MTIIPYGKHFIDEADIDEIIQSHIINNTTVERLMI